jgi:bifunctional non-homologous end joining protein LigD
LGSAQVNQPTSGKKEIHIMNEAIESITLYYKSGSSDKVYQASIEPAGDDKFHVHFAYGRRGSALNTGVKTSSPVAFDRAKAIYDKLVKSKTAKGYTPGADGTPHTGTGSKNRDTGVQCQLLNAIGQDGLTVCLSSDRFLMQPKFDGRRLLVRKHDGQVIGINRRGLEVGLPGTIAESANALPGDFIIDGEAVGDTLHAFDLLEENGACLRSSPYRYRFGRLTLILAISRPAHIVAVNTAATSDEKRAMFDRLRNARAEGVVFKDADSPYTPGRPNSGGSQLKFKFHKSATCLVTGRNGDRRSVSLALFKNHKLADCGNVTIPANHEIPTEGAVVEVRYLYAMPESNALYQPVYLGVRDDMTPIDCELDQLEYKQAA